MSLSQSTQNEIREDELTENSDRGLQNLPGTDDVDDIWVVGGREIVYRKYYRRFAMYFMPAFWSRKSVWTMRFSCRKSKTWNVNCEYINLRKTTAPLLVGVLQYIS